MRAEQYQVVSYLQSRNLGPAIQPGRYKCRHCTCPSRYSCGWNRDLHHQAAVTGDSALAVWSRHQASNILPLISPGSRTMHAIDQPKMTCAQQGMRDAAVSYSSSCMHIDLRPCCHLVHLRIYCKPVAEWQRWPCLHHICMSQHTYIWHDRCMLCSII
jgi:hypothetical protein